MHLPTAHLLRRLACIALAVTSFCGTGCVNSLKNTIPAQCLPPELVGPSRDDLIPIDFTMLGQKAPAAHVIGPNDVLGIHIQGVLGQGQETAPATHYPTKFGDSDSGNFLSPAVGTPITVGPDGTITLPLVPPIPVAGLTLAEATEKIRETYTVERQLLQPGRDIINVTLIKARSMQVLVLREDAIMNWPILKPQTSTLLVKRGSGNGIDLPMYQNDVLHALTESGGLPGSDATNEVWVLHGARKEQWEAMAAALDRNADAAHLGLHDGDAQSRLVRIPLKLLPGEVPGFTSADVTLETGDVVYIPSRDFEHFFIGGVLNGQQVFLPRDYELDVLGAISMAGGSPTGPPGSAASSLFGKIGSGPGAILPPTRVLILRKVPGGDQITIHVDLKKCIHDRKERIPIRPGDVILLQFTPGEIVGNYFLNLFNFNATISRTYFSQVQ
jgi:hypothetical protein